MSSLYTLYTLAIHGGAGTISKASMSAEAQKNYEEALLNSLKTGETWLKNGGDALTAVEKAVVELENNPLFNAGKGAVFTHEGQHEMDASVMEGKFLNAGAVSGLKHVKNPVLLARKVMDEGMHPAVDEDVDTDRRIALRLQVRRMLQQVLQRQIP